MMSISNSSKSWESMMAKRMLKTSNKQKKHKQKIHVRFIYVKCEMHLSPGRRLSRSPNCAASPWIPGSLTVPRPDRSWMPCFFGVYMCFKTWDVPQEISIKNHLQGTMSKYDLPKSFMFITQSLLTNTKTISETKCLSSAPNFFPTAAWPIPTALMAAYAQWKSNHHPFAFDVKITCHYVLYIPFLWNMLDHIWLW